MRCERRQFEPGLVPFPPMTDPNRRIGQQVRFPDFQTIRDADASGPVFDVQVQRIPFARRESKRQEGEGRRLRAVDRVPVDLHPGADALQVVAADLGNGAVLVGADVEQEVAALADDFHEFGDQFVGRFPVVIVCAVSPVAVHRHAGLPGPPLVSGSGDELLRRDHIARNAPADAVVEDDLRMGPHALIETHRLLMRNIAALVHPDDVHVRQGLQQFVHLREGDLIQIGLEIPIVGRIPVAAAGARMIPVLDMGIIETEAQALLPAGAVEFGDHILAVGRRVHDVVGTDMRMVHRKPVVVLGGDDQVALAGLPGEAHPVVGVETHGIELRRKRRIFRDRNLLAVHHPLAAVGLVAVDAGQFGVDAPMDEQSELGLPEPFHFVGNGLRGRRRGVRLGKTGQGNERQERGKKDSFHRIGHFPKDTEFIGSAVPVLVTEWLRRLEYSFCGSDTGGRGCFLATEWPPGPDCSFCGTGFLERLGPQGTGQAFPRKEKMD